MCVNPTLLAQNGAAGRCCRTRRPRRSRARSAVRRRPPGRDSVGHHAGSVPSQCKQENGASWLQVNTVGTARTRGTRRRSLGPDWGLHLYDVNIALGNLVKTVATRQAYAYGSESLAQPLARPGSPCGRGGGAAPCVAAPRPPMSPALTGDRRDPPLRIPAADREGGAGRRRGDLAQADGQRRPDQADGRGDVDVAAGRLARAPAGRSDHPRGDGRDRRPGDADAGAAARRAVAQDRAARDRGAVQAERPQGLGAGAGDDPRGGRHLSRRADRALLPRPAADPLPLPGQGARRAAARAPGCCARASSS